MYYYAVHKGRKTGIYPSWVECKKQVDGFEGAVFKKFKSKKEAINFYKDGWDSLKIKKDFSKKINSKGGVEIYTDGSLIRRDGKIYCGYGVYIPSMKIKKGYKLRKNPTINRAELSAIIKAIKLSTKDKPLHIFTDSKYSILIGTTTGNRYRENNYKIAGKDVLNKDLIKKLHKVRRGHEIYYHHVRSHTKKNDRHSLGNEVADKLAVKAALL